jgi:hypothetical protein
MQFLRFSPRDKERLYRSFKDLKPPIFALLLKGRQPPPPSSPLLLFTGVVAMTAAMLAPILQPVLQL